MTDDWIGIILPTKDGKYVMARATIVDEDINTLKDAVISVSDVEGIKSDLKYPFVLLKDIEILRKKLIEDLVRFLSDETGCYEEHAKDVITNMVNKRFEYE